MTEARVTQAGAETVVAPNPDVLVTQVGADVALALASTWIRLTQAGLESALRTQSVLDVTQLGYESALRTQSVLDVTQLGYEAVVFAPPTRWANAFMSLSRAQTRSAPAFLRLKTPGEKERYATTYMRLRWASQGVGAPIPPPALAPILTITHGAGGNLALGTYTVGYTWVDEYGQTTIGPVSTIVIDGPNEGISVQVVETPPAGAIGYEVYITPVNHPELPPLLFEPGGTSSPVFPLPSDGSPPVDPVIIINVPVAAGIPALPAPMHNTTGFNPNVFDHDFRDVGKTTAPGTLGWRPTVKLARTIVVRSGETDVGQLPIFNGDNHGGYIEQMPPNFAGTWMFRQNPPLGDPRDISDMIGTYDGAIDPVRSYGVKSYGVGTLPAGRFWAAFTYLDQALNETTQSLVYFNNGLALYKSLMSTPDSSSLLIEFAPVPSASVPPTSVNFYVSPDVSGGGIDSSWPLTDGTGDTYGPALSTFVRQNATPILLSEQPWTWDTLVTDGPTSPAFSSWPPPRATDGAGRAWFDPDYQMTFSSGDDPWASYDGDHPVWHRPYGGFHSYDFYAMNQTHGFAIYDPNWRALPSAAILCDRGQASEAPAEHLMPMPPYPVPLTMGPSMYYRHVWNQPGSVPEGALLTMRWNGKLTELYVNGQPLLGSFDAGSGNLIPVDTGKISYWRTVEFQVPASLLRMGVNALAFVVHTSTREDRAEGTDNSASANGNPTAKFQTSPDVHVGVTGGNWSDADKVTMTDVYLQEPGDKAAIRPDGTSRQYWSDVKFATGGGGFQDPGDKGPGFWGYYGDRHMPEFEAHATWDNGDGATPSGERTVYGPGGGNWPPIDNGFGVGDIWQSGDFSLGIGDTHMLLTADRFNMISVGRIGGGGNVHVGAHIPGTEDGAVSGAMLTSSDEWGPGACFLLSIPTLGPTWTERTVFNDMVRIQWNGGFPFDADPWDPVTGYSPPKSNDPANYPQGFASWAAGQVVATVPVSGLRQVFITAVSRDPTIANLGKARMWVYWLDASGAIGGALCRDTEFLHGFGRQPATLWPYSENLFWVADYYGEGAWTKARTLQIVMFNHVESYKSDPNGNNKGNEWLLNITVRENVVSTTRGAQWV